MTSEAGIRWGGCLTAPCQRRRGEGSERKGCGVPPASSQLRDCKGLDGESGNGSNSPAPTHPVPLWLQQTQGTLSCCCNGLFTSATRSSDPRPVRLGSFFLERAPLAFSERHLGPSLKRGPDCPLRSLPPPPSPGQGSLYSLSPLFCPPATSTAPTRGPGDIMLVCLS